MSGTLIAVITGDVIASRTLSQSVWMPELKRVLSEFGARPVDWDIYRGDAFQLKVSDPIYALYNAMRIKSGFKSTRDLDIRMAIGIGTMTNDAPQVSECNGSAFVLAGSLIDTLASRHSTLAVASPWPDFDEELNAGMAMAAALMDRWLPNYAEVMAYSMREPQLTQKDLGEKLGIAQNTISERQTRAYRRELLDFELFYRKRLSAYLEKN